MAKTATIEVTVRVEKGPGSRNFACYMVDDTPDFGLAGYGPTAAEAISDLYVSQTEMREVQKEQGKTMPELHFNFKFDLGSLFDYYSFLNISGVAKRAGINASLMRQYVAGVHKPSAKRLAVIGRTMKDMAKDIASVELW